MKFSICAFSLVVSIGFFSSAHAEEISSVEQTICSRQCGPPPQVIHVPVGQAGLDMTCDEQACKVQVTVFTGDMKGVVSEPLVGQAFVIYVMNGRRVAVPRRLEALKERSLRSWKLQAIEKAIDLTVENLAHLVDPSWAASRTEFDSKTGEYGLKLEWQEVKTSVRYTKPQAPKRVEVLYAPRPASFEPVIVCDCKSYWGRRPPEDKPRFRVKRIE